MKLESFAVMGFALVTLLVGCNSSATSSLTAEKLLPVEDVKRIVKADSIEEVSKVPFGEGVAHNYLFPDKATLIFLLSTQGENYDALKKEYDEMSTDRVDAEENALVLGRKVTQEIDQIGDKCFVADYKIDALREESKSDQRLLMFKKGKYLVELKSVSRMNDSGHLVGMHHLMKFARIVDKNLPAPEPAAAQ